MKNQDKLQKFRDKVLSKISTFFTDTKDVKLAVLESIPKIEAEYELQGWVRSETIPDTKALADEIAKLHTENINLRDEVSKYSKKLDENNNKNNLTKESQEFEEIYNILLETKIDITGIKSKVANGPKLPDEINALDLALTFRDRLMRGVTNQIDMSDIDSFVFFSLCPKLQVHDLVLNEKVPSVRYRRYAVTKKGTKFFSYVNKKILQNKKKDETAIVKKSTPMKKSLKKKTAPLKKKKLANKLLNNDEQ